MKFNLPFHTQLSVHFSMCKKLSSSPFNLYQQEESFISSATGMFLPSLFSSPFISLPYHTYKKDTKKKEEDKAKKWLLEAVDLSCRQQALVITLVAPKIKKNTKTETQSVLKMKNQNYWWECKNCANCSGEDVELICIKPQFNFWHCICQSNTLGLSFLFINK